MDMVMKLIPYREEFDQIDVDHEGDECDYDDGLGIEELEVVTPQLIKMIDILGREHVEYKNDHFYSISMIW